MTGARDCVALAPALLVITCLPASEAFYDQRRTPVRLAAYELFPTPEAGIRHSENAPFGIAQVRSIESMPLGRAALRRARYVRKAAEPFCVWCQTPSLIQRLPEPSRNVTTRSAVISVQISFSPPSHCTPTALITECLPRPKWTRESLALK